MNCLNKSHVEELDARKCDQCHGEGWHWQMAQVGERKSDQQEIKTHCDECEGLGWLGTDAERAALATTQEPSA